MSSQDEVPLPGGIANRGSVVRVGDTVRRPLRSTSAATHALLRHLEDVGFAGAPRFLGVDAQGREVLSYIPGTAAVAPHPAWSLTDAALRSVARLLQEYQAAAASFDPRGHAWPRSPPAPFDDGLVGHNDPNLDNVVFRDERAVAFIDFDLASPGDPLWDVAAAARLWAPLRSDVDIDDSRRGDSLRRLRVFADACALDATQRERLVDAVVLNHDWLYDIVSSAGELGNAGYRDYWVQGGADRAGRTRAWLAANTDLFRRALE